VTFTHARLPHKLFLMRQSAAVLCHDETSLRALKSTLGDLNIEFVACSSGEKALESVLDGRCSTLIVDFDLPGAQEVIRMASLLPPGQKPALLAVACRAWPGTGAAFQSGANRILYRPLDAKQMKDALQSGTRTYKIARKSTRYELKTLVHLETEHGTLAGLSIDIGEHGLALQATEPVPISANLPFRCTLPGTDFVLKGHADVIWASEHGRAGLFFSKLGPASRKHLKNWLGRRSAHSKHDKDAAPELLPPVGDHVSFAAEEEASV
jgi:DNA-binding response OmpR family regulator